MLAFVDKLNEILNKYQCFNKGLFYASMVVGAIYLNSYLSGFGIPFPLDINLLPTTLLVVGILSAFFLALATVYTLLIGIMNEDPLGIGLQRIISTCDTGIYAPKNVNYIKHTLVSYILPFTLSLVLFTEYDMSSTPIKTLLILIGYIAWAFIYSIVITRKEVSKGIEKFKLQLKITTYVSLMQLLSIISFVVFLSIVLPRAKNIETIDLILITLGYVIVNSACTLPSFSKAKFAEINTSNKNITAERIVMQTHTKPTYMIIIALIFCSFIPGVPYYVGEIPLKFLNIGGGIDFAMKDSISRCINWPDSIIDKKTKDYCTSRNGKLILRLGDRGYAVFDGVHKDTLVSIKIAEATIVTKIPKDSHYLDQ
jgi:hypothetical protein